MNRILEKVNIPIKIPSPFTMMGEGQDGGEKLKEDICIVFIVSRLISKIGVFVMVSIFATILLIIVSFPVSAAEYDDGYSAGTSSAQSIMSEINQGNKINNRIQVPMTSDSGSLTTFQSTYADPNDPGPQNFNVQLTTTSSNVFLEVMTQPGATGDINSLIIRQDTDFDDTFDSSYTSPVIASGVCADGIISCQPGTWNNCRFYKWQVNQAGSIFLGQVADITHLAGCYCINSSCGSDLVWNNMAYVLKDLGGGVVGTIQKSYPNVLITKVSTDAVSIKYYGQRSSDAGVNQGGGQMYFSGSQKPQQYYNPQGGILPANDEVLAQQGDTSSPYYQINRTYDARLNPKEDKSCTISHTVSITQIGDLVLSTLDTCASLDLNGCILNREELCDYENKNCVLSVLDGNATGLSPICPPISISDSEVGLSYTVTTDGTTISYELNSVSSVLASDLDLWWNIHRTYLCDTGVTLDTDDALDISNTVSSSVNKAGSMIQYEEYDPATGTTTAKSVTLPDVPEYGPCEMACKVQKNSANTQTGAEANTWQYQNSVDSIQVIYKSCGPENVCPVEQGEIIIQDCTCLDEFANAASHMQVMEDAANDMICNQRKLSFWEKLLLLLKQ